MAAKAVNAEGKQKDNSNEAYLSLVQSIRMQLVPHLRTILVLYVLANGPGVGPVGMGMMIVGVKSDGDSEAIDVVLAS